MPNIERVRNRVGKNLRAGAEVALEASAIKVRGEFVDVKTRLTVLGARPPSVKEKTWRGVLGSKGTAAPEQKGFVPEKKGRSTRGDLTERGTVVKRKEGWEDKIKENV